MGDPRCAPLLLLLLLPLLFTPPAGDAAVITGVPFWGRRMHHTCPCLPGLACLRTSFNRFICLARK
ncbi:prokineticin-2 isoform 3 precursor [Mus musculus]|uniref:Prokineticin 2 n=1 Tax=Mus musculus TaxID=10090 RepID=G3X8R6_MOUSE|nr:prokineticin-2 isoform 3 precursor [Mus musculus]EDK99368.1 prokineticin 2, isoform CRA_b [Mus musculus]|eukprot:NP_001163890.1 prokineticin-2 isoform 3 precursor [Mus musculus]